MRLVQALGNLWRGFVSLWIKDIAVANPEAAYEGVIQKRLEERARLLQAAGVLAGERNKWRRKLEEAEGKLAQCERSLRAAISGNREQVGALLLQQKQQLEAELRTLRPQVQQLDTQAEQVKRDVARFNRSILELQQKAKVQVARLRAADARQRMQDMLDGLSIRGDDQMIQAIDDAIEAKAGAVEIAQEIDGATNVEAQLREVEETAAKDASVDEFRQLRQQFEAGQGVHAAAGVESGAAGGDSSGGKHV